VLSSICSTAFALTASVSGILLAALTATPGAMLLLITTFRFSDRAKWHYAKKNKLNALLRQVSLPTSALPLQEVVAQWNKIDEDMEASWPSFGILPNNLNNNGGP
jgi:hypothetical protein